MTHDKGKYYIATFGCQMNAHDSEKLAGMLLEIGYTGAVSEKEADIVVYNTCCIRESAENKIYGNLGYLKNLKEKRPDMLIAVCGCMTQQPGAVKRFMSSYKHVDVVFGTYNLHKLPELLAEAVNTGRQVIDVWDERPHGENVPELPQLRENRFKSGVNIMYGCDNFCSYCIVPYVRGREHSRPYADIIDEVRRLAADGVKEVMLLGQNVNSYGKSLGGDVNFPSLLEMVSQVRGIERIRFMTSHPKDLSDALMLAMRDLPNVCGHIHLPVQSGSDNVLKRMNRRYTREGYLELVGKIREAVPGIAVTTDIIVGFPGETEPDFEETLSLAETVRFNGAYTFLYSKRSGTPAAEMDGQIDSETASKRFQRLLGVINPIVYELNRAMEGKTVRVLAESQKDNIWTGRADDNSLVHFNAPQEMNISGEITEVRITEGKPFYLLGEIALF